jgi:large subunit ribosomal protein L21
MYAVIKTGGKQYRVQAGDLLVVEKLDGEAGAEVAFNEVLMLGEGADVVLGAPAVDGAVVTATLIETRKGEKVKIFKKIRRQGYRRTRGHRQFESVLRVTSVAGQGKEAKWDGAVDLTPLSVLNARARGLAPKIDAPAADAEAAPAKAAKAKAEPKAAAPKAPRATKAKAADAE